jgi:multimeric flavodoxin WrbA
LPDKVMLSELTIGPCDVCNACHRTGKCVKPDGMQGLYDKLLWADALVIGIPVYWWGPSAQTKAFVDRWYAFDNRREAFRGKPFAVVSTSGSGWASMADYVFGMFRSIASYWACR